MTAGGSASATKEVLVLGGTGSVGTKVSHAIARRGHAVLVASRELRRATEAAREIPGASPVETGDLRRPTTGRSNGAGFVVNCTGEEDPAIATAWTAQGWGFIDANDSFRNFSDPAWIDFPAGFGRRRAWRYDFADRVMLPARTNLEISTRYCFDSRLAGEAMATASIILRAPRTLLKLAPLFQRSQRGTDWWAFVARTDTGSQINAVGRSQSRATAELTADAVDTYLNTPPGPGFHYLTDLTTLDDIEARLPELGTLIDHSASAPTGPALAPVTGGTTRGSGP